jgi:hypothetical protein
MGPVPKLCIMQIFIKKGLVCIILGDLFRIDHFATIAQLGMNIIFVVVFSTTWTWTFRAYLGKLLFYHRFLPSCSLKRCISLSNGFFTTSEGFWVHKIILKKNIVFINHLKKWTYHTILKPSTAKSFIFWSTASVLALAERFTKHFNFLPKNTFCRARSYFFLRRSTKFSYLLWEILLIAMQGF